MDLKKGVSFFGVFSIATGAMISSGIFILPGMAFSKAGPAVFLSYFIAGLLGLVGILSVIELATAMPRAGGDYYFINKAFGPMLGTLSGFLGWLALSLKSAFAVFGITKIVEIYTGIDPLISGLVLTLFFIILNIAGVKEAAFFQITMVAGLLILMVVYISGGMFKLQPHNFTLFLNKGINNILKTSGFIFISFGGLLKVANISEEVKNPKRNLPLGLISSVLVVTLLYTLITMVITGTLDSESFQNSLTPVADSARLFMGETGYLIILIASVLAFFTTANAGIMAASRYPMALSRDKLLPEKIAEVNKQFKTPLVAIILTGVLIYLSLLLPLEILVKSASSVILTSYVLTIISVIILRESHIINYKPSFKTPFYPWLQLGCIALFTFFIFDMGAEAIEISLGFMFLSFCIYMIWGRKVKESEFALLHLLKRIIDKRLLNHTLEDELREVIVSRDNIEQDDFDRFIKQAHLLDVEDHLDYHQLINRVAVQIAAGTGMPEAEIKERFIKRQQESNTAITDFLAIPHIIIDGRDKMFLIIVRARKGIKFTPEREHVKAVFILGGTREQRHLHLKTLASIGTLVSQKDFKQKWLETESLVELKNLLILNKRKRFL
ncbi:MAG TPA: amino acid permease [Spirochaetota bacterium]|nr:amino acid permease [Spirochaetota bacterium]